MAEHPGIPTPTIDEVRDEARFVERGFLNNCSGSCNPAPHVGEWCNECVMVRHQRRLVGYLERVYARLREVEEEIVTHAAWAREYGKTPDGQAALDMARKLRREAGLDLPPRSWAFSWESIGGREG